MWYSVSSMKKQSTIKLSGLFAFLLTSTALAGGYSENGVVLSVVGSTSSQEQCHQENLKRDSIKLTSELVGVRPTLGRNNLVRPFISVAVGTDAKLNDGATEVEVKLETGDNSKDAVVQKQSFSQKSPLRAGTLTTFNFSTSPKKGQPDLLNVLVKIKTASGRELVLRRDVHVLRADERNMVLDRQGQCYKSTNPNVISDLYYNNSKDKELTVDYDILEDYVIGQEYQRFTGIADLQIMSGGNGTQLHTNLWLAYSPIKSFKTEKTKSIYKEHSFHVNPQHAGYIVKWDTVVVVPAKDIGFNNCGTLDYDGAANTTFIETLSSYQMMAVDPMKASDSAYVQGRLKTFKPINSCKQN